MEHTFRQIVEKIFNNWTGLRLAVEHGAGGRNGHKTAIEIMDYMYQYCMRNDNLTEAELQAVLEDLMDQEFDTLCEDNSILEISSSLLKYISLCQANKSEEIQSELNKLPNTTPWLRPGIQIVYKRMDDDSSSSSDDEDEDMEVDESDPAPSQANRQTEEPEVDVDPGWTLVTKKKK